jgi:predicted dithiol-disulfide oxidoreductase (DUF899 family)
MPSRVATATARTIRPMEKPKIVPHEEWQKARDELLRAEKEATRALDAIALPALAEHGVGWANVSNMPLAQIEAYKARMGWTLPFVSSRGTSFSADCGFDRAAGRSFGLTVFLRDGDDVYRTYSTTARGVDRLVFLHGILDLVPYGRQQDWEDSPPGWPQRPTYG